MSHELDPMLSFATLVAGTANQLGLAAGRALAEAAPPPFNPLFVVGQRGQGKTHLLQAIGNLRSSVDPEAAVRYATWDTLVEGYRAADLAGQVSDFLAPYRDADLLLLDDLEPLREAGAVRRAVLGLLEARLIERHATALGSSLGPAALLGPDDPAVRLLGGGLVVEIGAPNPAMREEIVRRRAADAGISFSRAVVDEVVHLPLDSIRDLVGAVGRLIAFQAVSPAPLAPSQARVLITGVLEEVPAGPASEAISSAVEVLERPPPEPSPERGERDEFGSFLSDIVAGVSAQVDRWRESVADAVLRWEAEGFHTARLHALLDQELPAQPELVLQRFEADVRALREAAAEIAELAPDLLSHEALRDPDQLAVALQLREQARARGVAAHLPDDQLRLDDLVEGASNRAALQVVREAAAAPGRAANPVVILGESGAGKTHLLHALGNALMAHGVIGVTCLGAQALCSEVEEALRLGRVGEWRRKVQWVGGLLVDDLHLLAGREPVQEVLLDLLDQLLTEGRQTGFTSSLPLTELSGLLSPLLARLAAGTIAELPRPDRDVRRGVVRQMLAATEGGEDAALIDYLASRPADSVRAVQATAHRVLRAAEARQGPPSLPLARDILEAPPARTAPPPVSKPGILGPTVGGTRLREKLVESWPSAQDRLIEELS